MQPSRQCGRGQGVPDSVSADAEGAKMDLRARETRSLPFDELYNQYMRGRATASTQEAVGTCDSGISAIEATTGARSNTGRQAWI